MRKSLLSRLGLVEINSGVCGESWVNDPGGGEIGSIDPSTGELLARVRMGSTASYDQIVDQSSRAFATWRMVPAPRRGEVVRQIGLALREHKADLGLLITLETGQDPLRGGGRGPGDDRHVRLRRRPVAPAPRPDDRQRAAPAPDDRAVASAGADRDHHGVQLPGRRLGLERHGRGRLRRHDGLEAVAAGAADGGRGPADRRTGWRRSTASPASSTCAWARPRTSASGCSATRRLPLISATGSCRMGRRVAEVVGRPAGPDAARARRQQRHHHHPERRPRAGAPRHRLRGGRHGRPAVHDGPAADRPRVDPRRVPRAADRRLPQPARSAIRGRTASSSGR